MWGGEWGAVGSPWLVVVVEALDSALLRRVTRAIYCFGKCRITTNSVVTNLINTMCFFQNSDLRTVKLVFSMTATVGF